MAHFFVTSAVCPLKVLGMSLQLSVGPNKAFYEHTSTEVTRLAIAKSYETAVKERSLNALQLSSGVTASNMPFRAPIYTNYREAFMAISGQGYQGFYKGNLVHSLHFAVATGSKHWLSSLTTVDEMNPSLAKLAMTLLINLGCDIASQPLSTIHTRFVLQSRIPTFATYKSLYNIFIRIRAPEMYQGYTVILPYNLGFSLTSALLSGGFGPSSLVIAAFISSSVVYPFTTVQRRLECQSREHTMLPRRYLGWRYAMSKIYHEEGLWNGLYRGFLANSVAVRLIQTTCRLVGVSWLTLSLFRKFDFESFRSEGLDLIN